MIYRATIFDVNPDQAAIEALIERGCEDFSSKAAVDGWFRDEQADYALVAVYDEDPDSLTMPDPVEELTYDGTAWEVRR